MPPPIGPSPAGWRTDIDRAWAANPNPGRVNAVHRLNRTQYSNAVRDLFALDPVAFDVKSLLPGDETADGSFDNFADVLTISTAHLERYLSAARQVTRLATGMPPTSPGLETFEIPLHVVQEDRQHEDLPFGSRGGIAVRHDFPADGEYLIKVRLRRQYQDYIMGMGWPQQLDVRLDGKLLKRFTVGGKAPGTPAAASYAGDGEPGFAGAPEWEDLHAADRRCGPGGSRAGFGGTAHRRRVVRQGVVGAGRASAAAATRQGLDERPDLHGLRERRRRADWWTVRGDRRGEEHPEPSRHLRVRAAQCIGGHRPSAPRRFFPGWPGWPIAGPSRRPTSRRSSNSSRAAAATAEASMPAFNSRSNGSWSIPTSCCAFRRSRRRNKACARPASYRLSDVELASRLSFFLWSSIPDERLLDLAERGELSKPAILEQQVRRMLADPRATSALVDDFAAQWLNLRRVAEVVVHPDFYPDFDDNLLDAFKQETELFIASTLREDRSVLDLLRADYTFVNERLARHYGIPGVYGSRFRRVTLPNLDQRGGLLGNGALLATTSYPDRTSPVLRGKWLLDNIFGIAVPPPPPDVDTTLPETKAGAVPPTIRERLAQHRRDPVCSTCHSMLDPPGFALENFDAIGGWRTIDESGRPVDATGSTVSGANIEGLSGPARAPAPAARPVSRHADRKAAGLRARAAPRVLRSTLGEEDRPRCGRQRLSLVVADSGNREQSDVLDAGILFGDELTRDELTGRVRFEVRLLGDNRS